MLSFKLIYCNLFEYGAYGFSKGLKLIPGFEVGLKSLTL